MKMYTNSEQTAKLIKLGFEKPSKKGLLFQRNIGGCHTDLMVAEENYSLGELIEILPIELEDVGINTTLAIHFDNNIANVEYIGVLGIEYSIMKEELIDALYAMIVKLKEKEII